VRAGWPPPQRAAPQKGGKPAPECCCGRRKSSEIAPARRRAAATRVRGRFSSVIQPKMAAPRKHACRDQDDEDQKPRARVEQARNASRAVSVRSAHGGGEPAGQCRAICGSHAIAHWLSPCWPGAMLVRAFHSTQGNGPQAPPRSTTATGKRVRGSDAPGEAHQAPVDKAQRGAGATAPIPGRNMPSSESDPGPEHNDPPEQASPSSAQLRVPGAFARQAPATAALERQSASTVPAASNTGAKSFCTKMPKPRGSENRRTVTPKAGDDSRMMA